MEQTQLPLGPSFENRGLFADHFLKTRLPDLAEWRIPDDLERVFEKIKSLYRAKAVRFTTRTNEAQTEHDFIRPVLDVLWGDDCYEVQAGIPNLDARRQPDYAFFRHRRIDETPKRAKAHLSIGVLFLR